MSDTDTVIDFAKALSQVRKSNTPAARDDGSRRVYCVECGQLFTRGRNQRHRRCPTCSRVRQIEAGRQLRDKSGPYYERMVIGKIVSNVAEAERLGIDWRKALVGPDSPSAA